MSINHKRREIEGSLVRPLISAVTSRGNPPSPFPEPERQLAPTSSRPPSLLLPKSKATMMILLWNAVVGFTFAIVIFTALALPLSVKAEPFAHLVVFFLCTYSAIAMVQVLFYPLGGLVADLRYGRYKTVWCSLVSIWAGYIFVSLIAIVYITCHMHSGHVQPVMWALGVIMALLLVTGFTGFQANAVQFGLDQLLDVSSKELSVFLHWYVWMDAVGTFMARMLGAAVLCNSEKLNDVMLYSPFPVLVSITVLVVFTYYKRKWFHCEPRTHNPYGMVYHVLKFVAKHNRPVRPPSAFTYCDDEIPTRMEFAKQRFGGPFSTETVEDVKTFLRILAMLLLVTPVFNLHIASSYILPLYGIYFGEKPPSFTDGCTPAWMFLQSGSSSYIVTILFLPPYIMFIHPNLTRCMPRILHRLLLGIVLLIATVAIMLGLLMLAKHAALQGEGRSDLKCLFQAEVRAGIKNDTVSSRLHYHTPLLIIPSIITGITIPLTYITIMEFISAQSPHTMKGLLLGVFYAFRGLFIMLGCIFMFPFVQPEWWEDSNGSLFDCGFSYYLTSTVFGVVGIATVSLGVKWYHYRDRQDRPYGPSYVEEYYSRYNRNARSTTMVASASEEEAEEVGLLHAEINNSILAYGTMDGT